MLYSLKVLYAKILISTTGKKRVFDKNSGGRLNQYLTDNLKVLLFRLIGKR